MKRPKVRRYEKRWRYVGDHLWFCDCHDCKKRRKHGARFFVRPSRSEMVEACRRREVNLGE